MGDIHFEINPDLASAATLPSECYLEPHYLSAEKEKIFWATWQPVARIDQLAKVGDFVAANIVGEPVVVVRGEGGLKAFSNVCRHRASLVAEGSGNAKCLQCPYHGWTYDLEGRLRGQPEFEGVRDWDKSKVSLPEMKVATWGVFVFVNIDGKAKPLPEFLGNIPAEVESYGAKLDQFALLARKEYIVECNWKVYVDNYLEGYHLPLVHPALFREIDYPNYRVETYQSYSAQIGPLRQQPGATRRYDPKDGGREALFYWVFPNFMVNVYPDNVSSNLVLPLGHERTLTIFEWLVPRERVDEGPGFLERVLEFTDQIQREDITICEKVQKGLGSRTYRRGRYSAKRENGVHHFHLLLQEYLTLGH